MCSDLLSSKKGATALKGARRPTRLKPASTVCAARSEPPRLWLSAGSVIDCDAWHSTSVLYANDYPHHEHGGRRGMNPEATIRHSERRLTRNLPTRRSSKT